MSFPEHVFGIEAGWAMPLRLLTLAEAGDIGAPLRSGRNARPAAGWLVTCLSGRFAHAPATSFAWWPADGTSPVALRTAGPALLACLSPEPALLQRAASDLALAGLPAHRTPILRTDAALSHALLDYAARATDRAQPAGRLEMDSRAALIGMALLRRHLRPTTGRQGSGLAPWQLERACHALTQDLSSPPSLAELAGAAGLSRFHFLRAFKQCTGLPPHAWLQQHRLAQAKRMLLADDSLSITALAGALGYGGTSQFARLFRRREGVAPSEFARRARLG